MKLTLDHTQRLNLHALLGAQRADVGSIRAIWAVQDRIALDADEEKAVELKRELVAGQERTVWNPSLSIPAKDFDFTDAEIARIKRRSRPGTLRRNRRSPMARTACRCAISSECQGTNRMKTWKRRPKLARSDLARIAVNLCKRPISAQYWRLYLPRANGQMRSAENRLRDDTSACS